jgi:flagellar biosynthesis protein FlhG
MIRAGNPVALDLTEGSGETFPDISNGKERSKGTEYPLYDMPKQDRNRYCPFFKTSADCFLKGTFPHECFMIIARAMYRTDKQCEIWAVAGGKGGTGKSFITSSIATQLALKGRRLVLIDADFGGANLHSFFGISRPKHSLSEFFEEKIPLSQIIVHSGISHMGLVTGALGSLDSESITYTQKQKLFRQIKSLEADYILIDLGAGSHINTLDTFLLADKMIVVTVPEITAIENLYQFIKSVYFRKLKFFLGSFGLKDMLQDVWKNKAAYGIRNLANLLDHVKKSSPDVHAAFEKEMSKFVVYIILNQVRKSTDILIGENLKSVCLKLLGLKAVYAGYADYDEEVQKYINRKEPFMIHCRLSPVIKEIEDITEHIMSEKKTGFAARSYEHARY